jgi:hypothetical protein
MNPFQLIMNVQQRMQQDPEFARRFNKAMYDLNSIPGLQQQAMQLAQISDDKQREKAMDKLPKDAKRQVKEILSLLTDYNIL